MQSKWTFSINLNFACGTKVYMNERAQYTTGDVGTCWLITADDFTEKHSCENKIDADFW